MKIMPPPPRINPECHKRRVSGPPPPPKKASAISHNPFGTTPEPELWPISPDLKRIDLEYAVWVHGGYPHVEWTKAVRELLRKCKKTPLGQICAAAIYELDRKLPTDVNLTMDDF